MIRFQPTRRRILSLGAASLLGAAVLPRPARANPVFPSKPVRIVLPYLTSGPNGIATRILADQLSEQWGVPVIVDSKPGGNGTIGALAAKEAPADGYTLLSGAMFVVLNPLIDTQTRFATGDFLPIASFGAPPNVIVVREDSPWRSLEDLVAAARKAPGRLATPHPGVGSSVHLGLSLFLKDAGIEAIVAPYKGSPPYVVDLLGGQLDFAFLSVQLALPQVQGGKLRVLATVSNQRLAELPEVPTLAEAGYPQAVVTPWSGLFARAGTPEDVLQALRRATQEALANAQVQQKYRQMYAELPQDPLQFGALVSAEETRWRGIVASRAIQDL
ncbi:putative exported protein [plant metagenome]|uniref:Putative exported protein n=1 Tax=plant metagenome TaxID=1297885 RepID=A0A484TJ03_9ZZZZ